MDNRLKNIFINHTGKISDKWSLYIDEWDEIFSPFRDDNINLLEIGIHNGGSLEIWAKYFTNAKHVIGCDINEDCRDLVFSDPRISVIIGDINSEAVEDQVSNLAQGLDIIIDDSSHKSGDIIKSFSSYFKQLNPGGLYIIEDLHTSYWDGFGGGFNNPYSALAFLRRLTDIINFEHWGDHKPRTKHLEPFEQHYGINFDQFELCRIHSIKFLNSLCIIENGAPEENKLGTRFVVGSEEHVSLGDKKLAGTSIHDLSFTIKDDSHLDQFSLINQLDTLNTDLEERTRTLQKLRVEIAELKATTQELMLKIAEQDQVIEQKNLDLQGLREDILEKEQLLQDYSLRLEQNEGHLLKLDAHIEDQDGLILGLRSQIDVQREAIQALQKDTEEQNHLIEQMNGDIAERSAYIKNLKDGLTDREKEILSYALDNSWRITRSFRKIESLFKGGWPTKETLKQMLRQRSTIKELRDYFKIRRSKLFDEAYYLQTYEDVRKTNIDPLMHFVKYGWYEGRNPSRTFSTQQYLELYPEIEGKGFTPLLHYLQIGKQETPFFSYYDAENHHLRYIDLSTDKSRLESITHNAKSPPTAPDIIILPIIDWDFRYQRPQQLASQLAKSGHRVFYVQTTFRHNDNCAPFIKPIRDNIFSVQLASNDRYIDIYSLVTVENVDDLEKSVQLLKDHFLINSAIIMVDLPIWRKLASRLKDHFGWKLLYDCMDLHTGFSESSHTVTMNEQHLMSESDLILATSHDLYAHVTMEDRRTRLVPNGTDFEFFHQASQKMANAEIENLSGKIIGYFGAIADWFDTDLVGKLAAGHPEWTFVLIGSTYLADLDPLEGLSNIHLLGEKPYSEIPKYLSHFDVCMIPFKNNPLTQATNPVKLYEYLSAGKPVVATRLNEISNYEDYVRLVTTVDEWEKALQESLAEEKTPDLLEKRFSFARENTWEKRAKTIQSEFLKLFPKISIIILSYDNLDYTKLCLASVENNTAYPNYEMIIVDNGSQKETVTFIKEFASGHPNVKLHLNEKNLGFAKANNQGFRQSDGDYIVFLNNDTIVTPGWLHRLLHHLKQHPEGGMVGPVTNDIGNEAKIDVNYSELSDIQNFATFRAKDYWGKSFSIKVLALYCCMISRELFTSVGGLDERYEIGMFEDDDLSMKVRQKGLDLRCAEDVFIHHFHGVSLNKLAEEDYQKIFEENKRKFEKKWGIKWESHQYR